MSVKVEVYIKNTVGFISQGIMRPVVDHWCSDAPIGRYEKVIPEEDRLAVTVAEEFANEKGLQIKVCDTCTLKGKLKARLKGIRDTPTIVIGNSRIEGQLSRDELKSKLESLLNTQTRA